MSSDPRDADATRLAAQSLAAGDPTAWFDRLYREAEQGTAVVPWDSGAVNVMLAEWLAVHGDLAPRRAVVVGCGLGRDAEHLAALGWTTTAFDVAPAAVAGARARYPGTLVTYAVADLLALPGPWRGAFDLVVESYTVQALPVALRAAATDAVVSLVAPGGRLLVLAAVGAEGVTADGPPWPLTPSEVDAFGAGGLVEDEREQVDNGNGPRWRVAFTRR